MTCCTPAGLAAMVAVDPDTLNGQMAEDALRASAHDLGNGLLQSDFIVPAMHCAACIRAIEVGLADAPGVDDVRVNLSLKRVSVRWRKDAGSACAIEQRLSALGFDHATFDLTEAVNDDGGIGRRLLISLAVAGFAAANIMLLSVSVWSGADPETARLFHLISGLIAVPAVAFAGRPFFSSAYRSLAARRLNMDVPISLAVILALAMSVFEGLTGGEEAYFDAAVTLLFFLLIGRTLDHLMRRKARHAVERLSQHASKGAVIVEPGGSLRYAPVADVRKGMTLRVAAGERFPVDGCIISGETECDRSLVTGESASISCASGTRLEAGTLNLSAPVDIEATCDPEQSFLAEVIRMMEAAEKGRGRYVRIADRMAQIYAPAVHGLAALAFVGWMIATGGDWQAALYIAIAVLIVTCPCALGLAVPVVHVIGAGRLFEAGIMMKDGSAFERLAECDHVIFDKTGTLTTGLPKVARIVGDIENASLASALTRQSSHPASKAIAARLSNALDVAVSDICEVPGAGLEAQFDGRKVRLGRPDWVAEISTDKSLSGDGVAFALCGAPTALFVLSENLREGAAGAVASLRKSGMKVELVSGDGDEQVAKIAALAGIEIASANNRPQDKIRRIEALQADGHCVLMVGDGLNDAPALAAGHASMAPASASDVGRLAADLVFTRESLEAIPFARRIAIATDQLVRQNFGLAILYNCIAVPLACAGLVTPLVAAIAMSTSSILVVGNSMRLFLYDCSRWANREDSDLASGSQLPSTGIARAA